MSIQQNEFERDLDETHKAIGTVSICLNSASTYTEVLPDEKYINKLQELLLDCVEKLEKIVKVEIENMTG